METKKSTVILFLNIVSKTNVSNLNIYDCASRAEQILLRGALDSESTNQSYGFVAVDQSKAWKPSHRTYVLMMLIIDIPLSAGTMIGIKLGFDIHWCEM